jgi:hypothetical protein
MSAPPDDDYDGSADALAFTQQARPLRIQRRRVKGWHMPACAVYVGRPTKWGNPFTRRRVINWDLGDYQDDRLAIWREEAVALFRLWAAGALESTYYDDPFWPLSPCVLDFHELSGKHLACWCRLDQPCHADVLLALANPGSAGLA